MCKNRTAPLSEQGLIVRKSNQFVTAKYKTSILGNKIIAISLTRIQLENGHLIARFYPSEIKTLLNATQDTNIYKKLCTLSTQLAGHVITIEDGTNFRTFSMITNVNYENQIFEVVFNTEMTPMMEKLQSNYTSYELATLISFEKNYAYRLYEILKKDSWKIKESKNGCAVVSYGVNELKCALGLVNLDADYIKSALRKRVSWDNIVENIAKKEDKQYDDFNNFKTHVLEVAKEEMREKADIRFEYKTIRKGRGLKVVEITFYIYANNIDKKIEEVIFDKKEKIEDSSSDYAELQRRIIPDTSTAYEKVKAYLEGHGIDTAGFNYSIFSTLLDYADNSLDNIFHEIDYSLDVPKINNYYAWLVKAVKNKYSRNEPVMSVYGETPTIRAEEFLSEDDYRDIWIKKKKDYEFEKFKDAFGTTVEELEAEHSCKELIEMFIVFKMRSLQN